MQMSATKQMLIMFLFVLLLCCNRDKIKILLELMRS